MRWEGFTPDDRVWLLQRISTGVLVLFSGVAVALVLNSPRLAPRVGYSALILGCVWLVTQFLTRTGRATAGALALLGGLFFVIASSALYRGGIESPGIQSYFLFVVMAGLLLGWRGAIGFALAIVGISGWMAIGAPGNPFPMARLDYTALDRWIVLILYTGVALFVVLAAERSQKRLLEALRSEADDRAEALQQLEAALDAAGVGRFVHENASDRFQPDETVRAMLGLESDAPDGTVAMASWLDRLHRDDLAPTSALVAPVRTGERHRARVAYRYHHPTAGLKHIDGTIVLQRDHDGSPLGITGLLLDRTQQQTTIHDLGERLKEMRLLYYAAEVLRGEPVDVVNTLTSLLQAIPPAWQYPEITEARLTLNTIDLATHGWTGAGASLEASIVTAEGTGRLAVEYRRVDDMAEAPAFLTEESNLLKAVAGLIATWLNTFAERARFKQIEERLQQAQRLQAVGTFASGIAHDFNNVLAAVIGLAEAARLEPASAENMQEDLEQIIAAGRRGQSLVQRIRRLGHREALVRRAVSLKTLVNEVVSLARPSAPLGVILRVQYDDDVPDAWVDASQIHQVLLNLISNAFYACRDNRGTVTIRVKAATQLSRTASARPECLLFVEDTGNGMPASVAARVFEPFYTTKGEEGTGLGLSMVYGIIRDHDGTITVSSTPGQGTTFEIRLPAAVISTSREVPAEPEPPAERTLQTHADMPAPGAVGVILLVDDNIRALDVTRRHLEQGGYLCMSSAAPREAMERFAAEPERFAMVISDMNMPELNGLEFIRLLRSIKPNLPAVICTGVDLSPVAPMLEQERIQWVLKPAQAEELHWAVVRSRELVG